MSNIPKKLQYTKSHEWVKKEGQTFIVGITDHAQTMLGDVVYIELPEVETNLEFGEGCAVVESVKAAADIYSPVAGEVIEINEAVIENPQLINQEPYGRGWLFRMKPFKTVQSELINADAYSKQVASEAH